jgi:hypothetical protein
MYTSVEYNDCLQLFQWLNYILTCRISMQITHKDRVEAVPDKTEWQPHAQAFT